MKKAMKRISMILAAIVILPFLLYGIFWLTVPISRSNEEVRAYVLRQIPMGTGLDDVILISEEMEWEIRETSADCGLRINDSAGNAGFASVDEMQNGSENPEKVRIVGEQAMFVELGQYYGPFHEAVFAYLAFDENGALVEVAIRRDIDAL